MTVIASTSSVAGVYRAMKQAAKSSANLSSKAIQASSTRDTAYIELRSLYQRLRLYKGTIDEGVATPGINPYAQEQEADPAYDAVAEYTVLSDEIQDLLTVVEANMPVDLQVLAIEDQSGDADSDIISPVFTPTQMAPIRNRLQDIVDQVT